MAVGCLVWVHSLRKALQLGRSRREVEPTTFEAVDVGQQPAIEAGSLVIRGTIDELSQSLVKLLRVHESGVIASLYAISQDPSGDITLTKTVDRFNNHLRTMRFNEAHISFEPSGSGTTEVSYRLGFERLLRRIRSITLLIIFAVGLPTLVGVGAFIWFQVVPAPQPAIRWQVLQTLQILHALWPPYLVMSFYSTRESKAFIESLIVAVERTD